MQVKDLMTKVVKVVTGEQSLLEIRELMLNNNLRRIPVVDGDGHLKALSPTGMWPGPRLPTPVPWTGMKPTTSWAN